jgi:hypothetical protein
MVYELADRVKITVAPKAPPSAKEGTVATTGIEAAV